MKFANPEAFLLFVPLLLVAFFSWTVGIRKRSRILFSLGTWIDRRPRFTLPSPFRVHFVMRFLALSCMIVGLARPQIVFTKTNRTVEAVDMIISFDLSKSMEAIDFNPNRRTVAINTLVRFVDKRIDDRIGLVLFSGEAYLAIPLTVDHEVLKSGIINSSNDQLQDGTAIGQSLAVAVSHLRYSKAKSRVIVLFTDGDNNMGSVDPITAAELAKGYGIKIYTIGIGKKGRVPFPIKSINPITGQETQVYQYLTDAVNDELLADIASRTGGKFFRAEEDNVLDKIFSTIDTLEKTKVETSTLTRYSESSWPWIIAAFMLLALEGLALNTRWRKIP